MKKHIVCHYKNGALLFCTTDTFPPEVAHTISALFNRQDLVTIVEQRAKNLFGVVGRANLNYDPFENGGIRWADVLSKMTVTLEILEHELRPFLSNGKVGLNMQIKGVA